MKQEITVSKIEDLQDGDIFVVGNEEWRIQGGELITPRWNWLRDGSFATDLIHALGKVKREIPDPEPPEGYRIATEEDWKGPKIRGYALWHNGRWMICPDAAFWPAEPWFPDCLYAVPLPTPEQDSNLEKQAEYIECEVVSAGSGEYTTLRLSKPHPLPYGTKLRVEVRKVKK